MADDAIPLLLDAARRHYVRNDHPAAEAAWREVLARDPGRDQALHGVGWLCFLRRRYSEAVNFLRQAADRAPHVAPYWNDLGFALSAAGDGAGAEAAYREALRLSPHFPEALHNLGNLYVSRGEWARAIGAFQGAVAQEPSFAAAYHDLGLALSRAGDAARAVAAWREAARLRPNLAEAQRNLGVALLRLGRPSEALPALAEGVRLAPQSAAARNDLGTALARANRKAEAIESFRKAVALDPEFGPAYCNLGLTLEEVGDKAEAVEALRQAKRVMPNEPMVAYHLASLGGGEAPATCPPEFVVELFDRYADYFDAHLVQTLGYRGPELLWEEVKPALSPGKIDVLDLGCGTGLCGVLFKPISKRLVGVDLAPRMVAACAKRRLYDELIQGDIVPVMRDRLGAFDLILAAEVFNYVGDLGDTFRAAAGALRQGSLFAFTVESVESGGMVLRANRRYAHSLDYVRRLAAEHRFAEVSVRRATLRTGEAGDVGGDVVVLRRE